MSKRLRPTTGGIAARRHPNAWAAAAVLIYALGLHAAAGQTHPQIPPQKQIAARVSKTIATPERQTALEMPTDVAVDKAGRVFVADGVHDRVVVFDADGTYQRSITSIAGRPLDRPVGLTVDAKDRLWIAEAGGARVTVIDATGRQVDEIRIEPGALGTTAEAPCEPTDVAVSRDGTRAVIVDNQHHRLLVRDNEKKTLKSRGGYGRSAGKFRWPFMAAITSDGMTLITEAIGARVQRLLPDGKWTSPISKFGVELGRLYRPKGIAVDMADRVFVSDSTLGVVQVFSTDNHSLGVLTDASGTPLSFAHPMGMAFDPNGRLLVVELKANRVAVVTLKDAAKPGKASAANDAKRATGEKAKPDATAEKEGDQ